MQNNQQHIDGVFRDGLKDITVIPPAESWSGIEGHIAVKPLSWTFRRVAATVAILMLAGSSLWIMNNRKLDDGIASDSSDQKINTLEDPLSVRANESANISDGTARSSESDGSADMTRMTETEIVPETFFKQGSELVKLNTLNDSHTRPLIQAATKDRNLDVSESVLMAALHARFYGQGLIPEDEMDAHLKMPPIREERNTKWGLGGSVSPLYAFRHVRVSDVGASNEFYYKKENPTYGFTGGLSAIFRKYDRLSFVTGIHFTRSGQSYNDVIFYQNVETGSILQTGILRENIPYPFKTSMGQISSADYPHYLADYILPSGELNSGGLSSMPEFDDYESFLADLTQSFDFLEIPLLVKYKVLDKKVGIHVVSGVGTNFLIDNEVYLFHQGQKVSLGETTRLQKFNFTGSLGVGFEYNLNPKWSLNLEPTFRYFLNSINSSSTTKTHPYYFGVYSGMNVYF